MFKLSVLYLIYYFLFYYCIFILFIIIVCFVFCFVNSLSVFFFWCLFVLVCNILIIASNLVLDISVHLPLVLDKLFVLLCCGLLYPSTQLYFLLIVNKNFVFAAYCNALTR